MLTTPLGALLVTLAEVLRLEQVLGRTLPHGENARLVRVSLEELSLLKALVAEAKERLEVADP